MDIPIASIVIGERHRADLGDVCSLAKSIAEIGLLQPIVVTPDYRLIAGERRIAAFRQLGREAIPANVVDLDAIVRGEWAENAERKPFTPSEAVAIGHALEERERAKAREREQSGLKRGTEAPASESFPSGERGRTNDIVGGMLGMSGTTYSHAKTVVRAADDEPERFGELKAEMDRTGKVDGVYHKVRRMKTEGGAPPVNPKSRAGVAIRRQRMLAMARERFHVADIAEEVGLSKPEVARFLRDAGVETVSDRIGKLRRPEANRAMEGIVAQAMPAENALALVEADWDALDRDRFPAWADELRRAMTVLRRVESRLRKELA